MDVAHKESVLGSLSGLRAQMQLAGNPEGPEGSKYPVCVYICIYAYIYGDIYIYIHMSVYTYLYVYTYV